MQSVAPGTEKLHATGQAGVKGLLYEELLLQTEHGSAAGPRRGEGCTVQLGEGEEGDPIAVLSCLKEGVRTFDSVQTLLAGERANSNRQVAER